MHKNALPRPVGGTSGISVGYTRMLKHSALMLFVLSLFPSLALAHAGHVGGHGLFHGFAHPVGGADHLIAMVAVGLWAAQIGGRALWVVPSTFVGVMVVGGVLGFAGVAIPFIETGIVLSVLILGVLIASAFRLPLVYSALIVGGFAVFHGHAHGAEMPATIGAASYTAGFAMATATLHAAGMAAGYFIQRVDLPAVTRVSGSAVALSGIYLAVS